MNATRLALTINIALLSAALLATVQAAEVAPAKTSKPVTAKAPVPDSQQLEKALQRLSWQQFRSVIEAVPKMKAEVEAYGPVGWQIVEARYQTHAWKKSIDKLDDAQKRQLAGLIEKAGRR